jgi:protein-S-isoprenylcysteine O-methyltransferase Ste14
VVQRLIESYLPNSRKVKGVELAKWTWIAFSVTYPLLIFGSLGEYFLIPRKINLWISGIGLGIVSVRIWLKWWAMLTLGDYWSVQIEIRESHKLIKDGPYRYLRHPAYLSNLMEYLGVALIANAYYTLIGVLLIYLPLNLIRFRLEEKELIRKFGEEYEDYRKKVPALLPIRKQSFFQRKDKLLF